MNLHIVATHSSAHTQQQPLSSPEEAVEKYFPAKDMHFHSRSNSWEETKSTEKVYLASARRRKSLLLWLSAGWATPSQGSQDIAKCAQRSKSFPLGKENLHTGYWQNRSRCTPEPPASEGKNKKKKKGEINTVTSFGCIMF